MERPQTDSIILELIRKIVNPSYSVDVSIFKDADWGDVVSFATRQGVLGVTFDAIQNLPQEARPEMEHLIGWIGRVSFYEELYKNHEKALSDLSEFYNSHGIRMMLLKGWGLSLNYPTPKHRPTGDMDIWLFGDQEKADNIINTDNGIKPIKSSHHTVFFYEGVEVENHITFIEVDCHKPDGSEAILLDKSNDAPIVALSSLGTDIILPSANFNAFFLLRHSTAHFSTECITLRHLLDWAFFVDKYSSQIDWDCLYEQAKIRNMHIFLDCQNAICINNLGFSSEKFPVRERHYQLEQRIFRDILFPEFQEAAPDIQRHFFRYCYIKTKRNFANKWKYEITYKESFWSILFRFAINRLRDPHNFSDMMQKEQDK